MLGGIVNFYKYGEKSNDHFNFASRFGDIQTDLEMELVKERPYREAFDTFSVKIHMRLDSIIKEAPTLPKFIADDEKYKLADFNYNTIKQPIYEKFNHVLEVV
jgi:hypothetical protein